MRTRRIVLFCVFAPLVVLVATLAVGVRVETPALPPSPLSVPASISLGHWDLPAKWSTADPVYGDGLLRVQLFRIVGHGAVTCGSPPADASRREMKDALSCAIHAARRGDAFIVERTVTGTVTLTMEGLAASAGGRMLSFRYERDTTGSRFSLEPCDRPVLTAEGRETHLTCAR